MQLKKYLVIIRKNEMDEGQQIDSDICIIGGGPAAVSIAMELKDLRKNIVILAGGDWKETAFNRDLNRGIVAEGSSHEPLEQNRRRQFGGASAVWGGRCLPFERIDFMKRDWVDNSGWPFDYDELLPYYKKAAKLAKIGEFKFNVDKDEKKPEIIPNMDSEYIISSPVERWSTPVNFAKEYESVLKSSLNIKIYLNANVLKIFTNFQHETVSNIEVNMNGKKFKVSASKFILAAGGLENARLLLSSSNVNHPYGIGNTHDNVGRYYMAHLSGIYAEVFLNNPDSVITEYEQDNGGVYYRRRWWITDNAQREFKLRNIIFYLDNPNGANGHMTPIGSGVILAKSFLSVASQKSFTHAQKKMKEISPFLIKHLSNFLFKGWKQVPDIATKSFKRLKKRRLPSILSPKNNNYWGIYFQSEQTPLRESRITLANGETDILGMPRLKVDIKINPKDIESVIRAHNLFISHFQKSGLGSYIYTEEGLKDCLENLIKSSFDSRAHHIGTTRMSAKEINGVVDLNSKVYGIKNLYIAGASVFPTGSHANPTFTILAQSLRLAAYIKKDL